MDSGSIFVLVFGEENELLEGSAYRPEGWLSTLIPVVISERPYSGIKNVDQ